jgi:hypothetical protein
MRAYDLLLFMVLLGATNAALDYIYQSDFSDNWFGTHTESVDMEVITIGEDTVQSFEEGDTVSQDEQDSYSTSLWSTAWTIINLLYGLLKFDDYVLDKIFVVPDPDNPTVNLFAPINDAIMVGVYVVLVIGIYQLKSKTSVKHYE